MKKIYSFAVVTLLTGVVLQAQPKFSNALSFGTIDFGDLRQASGLAASRNNDAVLWTHNDSGDGPRLFAIDSLGRQLGTYNLSGANQVDYEDMAIGPGPVANVHYLYLGDIGDNNSSRSSITVYQIPEPAVYLRQAARPVSSNVKGFRSLVLTYPDGAHNAETLLVDPLTGDLFIGTKQPGVCRFYKATQVQMNTGGTINLSFERQVDFDMASGGDISPTGREIVLRRENFAQLWSRAPGQSVGEALATQPVEIPVVGPPTEPNGEAIGFDPIGRGYFTLSDSSTTQPLNYFGRASAFALTSPTVLVPAASTWRYLDNGSNPGAAWSGSNFDDSGWKTGEGQFGYGDNDEQTVVSFGPDGNSRYITTYFRKTFTITNLATIARAELKLLFDDGAAVYLNGAPVARANLPATAAFNTPATALQEDLEDTWFTFPVPAALLKPGTNTLAVEVHQASGSSQDLSFDLELAAFASERSEIVSLKRVTNGFLELKVTGPAAAVLAVEATDELNTFSGIGTVLVTNGVGLFLDVGSTNHTQRFYRLRQ